MSQDLEELGDEVERERAHVVAFLRAKANAEHPTERGVPALSPGGRGLLLLMADRIEAGEHRDRHIDATAAEARALAIIAELRAAGWSVRRIAEELDARGVPRALVVLDGSDHATK